MRAKRTLVADAKIVLFLFNLNGGGAERAMLTLGAGLSSHGYRVQLALLRAEGALLSNVPPEIQIIDLRSRNYLHGLAQFRQIIEREKPMLVYSMLYLANITSLLGCKVSKFQPKTIVNIQNTTSQQRRPFLKKIMEKWLLSLVLPWAHRIVAVSRGAAQDLSVYAHISGERITVIHNPVFVPSLLEKAAEAPEHAWFRDSRTPVILGVGRLDEQKNFESLIRAFGLFRRTDRGRLMILGEGPQRAQLEKLVEGLGLSEDVQLAGYVQNPLAFMKRAAVFVLSSRWEGLPSVLIEALAVGCPVVSTECPSGPDEILDGGKYGHLVPVDDDEALARAIRRAVQGDKRPAGMDWLRQYSSDAMIEKNLDLVEALSQQSLMALPS